MMISPKGFHFAELHKPKSGVNTTWGERGGMKFVAAPNNWGRMNFRFNNTNYIARQYATKTDVGEPPRLQRLSPFSNQIGMFTSILPKKLKAYKKQPELPILPLPEIKGKKDGIYKKEKKEWRNPPTSVFWDVNEQVTPVERTFAKRVTNVFKDQDAYDEPDDPIYWYPPYESNSAEEALIGLIRDNKLEDAKLYIKRFLLVGKPLEEWMYTLLIYKYAKKNLVLEALGLFQDAKKSNRFPLTWRIYEAMLYAFCLNRDIEGAQFLLEEMRAKEIPITQHTYEIFVAFKNPVYQYVEELLKVMYRDDMISPNGFLFGKMIDAFRRNYDYEKAIDLFNTVPEESHDRHLYTAMMTLYFDMIDPESAEALFKKMIRPGAPEALRPRNKDWLPYFQFYEKHGDYRAHDLLVDRFDLCGYPMNKHIFNSMIRCRFNGNNFHYAYQAFLDMYAYGIIPTYDTYVYVLDALVAANNIQKARQVLHYAKHKIPGFKYEYKDPNNYITSYVPKIQYSNNPPKVG